jgi:hypothetical protein
MLREGRRLQLREGRLPPCLEAVRQEIYRIRGLVLAVAPHHGKTSTACRRIRAPKPADETVLVLQGKHLLRVGTGSARLAFKLALKGDKLPQCLETADRGRPRIRAIAPTSAPHHGRACMACLRTCGPSREGGTVSVLRLKVRLLDGTGSGSREVPPRPATQLNQESRAVGTVSVSPNVPAREATAEHDLAMLRRSPVTAAP